jgi:hypothetical protein
MLLISIVVVCKKNFLYDIQISKSDNLTCKYTNTGWGKLTSFFIWIYMYNVIILWIRNVISLSEEEIHFQGTR